MEKYQVIKKLGSGSFGNVQKAQNIQSKEVVAIKQLKKKYGTWEQCLQLSEVKALRKISHPNIIKLKQVVRVVNDAYFVFQFIEKDLFKLITQRKQKGIKISDNEVAHFTRQITQALGCIHKQGFFHRDIKPENILISNDNEIKLIDFGIAKEVRSKPPFTQYISTRWYRAPELLFKFPTYSTPVDIFALGCLVAQMYMMKPLFQGNSEMDQISKICSVLGSPSNQVWPQGFKHACKKGINFPQYRQLSLPNVISNCPADALSFITQCLRWDPAKRFSAAQLLNHPFLNRQIKEDKKIQQNPYLKVEQPKQVMNKKNGVQQLKKDLDKDDEFEQLLNNFAETKIKSANMIEDDEDDW